MPSSACLLPAAVWHTAKRRRHHVREGFDVTSVIGCEDSSVPDDPTVTPPPRYRRPRLTRVDQALKTPREVADVELAGMAASVAHLAYRLGAMRQIDKQTRGPKEGTF